MAAETTERALNDARLADAESRRHSEEAEVAAALELVRLAVAMEERCANDTAGRRALEAARRADAESRRRFSEAEAERVRELARLAAGEAECRVADAASERALNDARRRQFDEAEAERAVQRPSDEVALPAAGVTLAAAAIEEFLTCPITLEV